MIDGKYALCINNKMTYSIKFLIYISQLELQILSFFCHFKKELRFKYLPILRFKRENIEFLLIDKIYHFQTDSQK